MCPFLLSGGWQNRVRMRPRAVLRTAAKPTQLTGPWIRVQDSDQHDRPSPGLGRRGNTWRPSVRVTELIVGTDPEIASTPDLETWVGDTAGLAVHASGAVHALWIDNQTGIRQVFTARVAIR